MLTVSKPDLEVLSSFFPMARNRRKVKCLVCRAHKSSGGTRRRCYWCNEDRALPSCHLQRCWVQFNVDNGFCRDCVSCLLNAHALAFGKNCSSEVATRIFDYIGLTEIRNK